MQSRQTVQKQMPGQCPCECLESINRQKCHQREHKKTLKVIDFLITNRNLLCHLKGLVKIQDIFKSGDFFET